MLNNVYYIQNKIKIIDDKFYTIKNTYKKDTNVLKKSIYAMFSKETKYTPNSDLPRHWHHNGYTFLKYSNSLENFCSSKYLMEFVGVACDDNTFIFSCKVYYQAQDTLIEVVWYPSHECEIGEKKTYKYKDFIKLCENITENTK
jgi:hypothetical protein